MFWLCFIFLLNEIVYWFKKNIFIDAVPPSAGWEKNERQRLGSRQVNLSTSMNPIHLAETAVGLNLRLMKWRLAPEIDLETLEQTRCLLLGSGTLGCNIARCLMVNL